MAISTKVQNIDIPWIKVVVDADPDFYAKKRKQLAYDFSKPGRYFYEDPAASGPYSNSYLLTTDGGHLLQESGGLFIIDGN